MELRSPRTVISATTVNFVQSLSRFICSRCTENGVRSICHGRFSVLMEAFLRLPPPRRSCFHLCLSLFVCYQDYLSTTCQIFTKLYGMVCKKGKGKASSLDIAPLTILNSGALQPQKWQLTGNDRGARSGSPEPALTGYWVHSCSQQAY